ncbi:putative pre-mRNA-splicing factor 38 [[Candida] jaroonii]|uniref:Pre-mRNA-splicing factor 38 n=1 Tax=[Candida] jaroonii TaxID=467808 RepID=A0ACA9Y9Q7_9ASCO|nr:putative pre-mRNA-splicing factor 38 [[Candida] jaroonii]
MNSNSRPSPFICCLLRLLEINPSSEILKIYLNQNKFKYLTALVLMFIRMTKRPEEVYNLFDNYITNFSKLRIQLNDPQFINGIPKSFSLCHVDEFVDDLLTKKRVVDVILPRLVPRQFLIDKGIIGERQYLVTSLDEDEEGKEEPGKEEEKKEDEMEEEFVSDSD